MDKFKSENTNQFRIINPNLPLSGNLKTVISKHSALIIRNLLQTSITI